MDSITLLGFMAAFLTTVSFFPQAVKAWKTKSTTDISLGMFLLLCAGILCWFLYGLLRNDMPIIVANGVTLVLASSILYFKLRYK